MSSIATWYEVRLTFNVRRQLAAARRRPSDGHSARERFAKHHERDAGGRGRFFAQTAGPRGRDQDQAAEVLAAQAQCGVAQGFTFGVCARVARGDDAAGRFANDALA